MKKKENTSDIKKFYCTLTFEYEDKKKAEAISKSLEVDNYSFVRSKQINNKIISEINSKSIPSLIHTIDDYLACVSVAEKTIELVKPGISYKKSSSYKKSNR